jgi:hypothetical protein
MIRPFLLVLLLAAGITAAEPPKPSPPRFPPPKQPRNVPDGTRNGNLPWIRALLVEIAIPSQVGGWRVPVRGELILEARDPGVSDPGAPAEGEAEPPAAHG